MAITPGPGESDAGSWRVEPFTRFIGRLDAVMGRQRERPRFLAVDGRSAGGKTTIAQRLQDALPSAAVVHTDDIAWNHSFFEWTDILVQHVLEPLRAGADVSYRPDAWAAHGRAGGIDVGAAELVIVEGVGSSQQALASRFDATIWVRSDFAEAERRGLIRDGGDAAAAAFWQEWMEAETPFLADDRPWERATVIVAGTPDLAYDPVTEIVVAGRRRPV